MGGVIITGISLKEERIWTSEHHESWDSLDWYRKI